MHTDIVELRGFYHSKLGQRVGHAITMALSSLWRPLPNERLLGIGYTKPWLPRFEPDTECTISFMPAAQGAARWPREGGSRTALVFDEELPLPDSAVDRILMTHCLEHSENPRETLMEMWRVLAPNGTLVMVVPNRRGVWARFEHTPFGDGRPFSHSQLMRYLRDTNFTPTGDTEALMFPPSEKRLTTKFSMAIERWGRKYLPVFGGVLVVAAQKRMYQGLPVAERQSRRVFVPALAPQPAAGMAGNGRKQA
ncbi:MAG: class I SAM-dependent methyltransferase [Pseudomonadota bacterium]